VIVLDMKGQRRLALPDNRFAQTGDVEAGGKRGAKTHLIDKVQGLALGFHPPRREAAKMEITMALKALDEQIGLRCGRMSHRTQPLSL
jgi:hypothetical protein